MDITNKEILCIGEVLWDKLPTGARPGGAPMNVAVNLKMAGQDVSIAGRVGNDMQGRELVAFLRSTGLDTVFIQTDDELPTSEVNIFLDKNGRVDYEICEPVAWDNIQLTDNLKKKASRSGIIVYGTLASRNTVSGDTIMKLLDNSALKILDVNFRKPYIRKELAEPLLGKSDLVKLNDEELEIFADWHDKYYKDEASVISWFAEHYDLDTVCVTKGASGAVLYDKGRLYKHPGYKINVVDPIGAGDAFLAGFIRSLIEGDTPERSLTLACATGALVAGRPGATPFYEPGEVTWIIQNS